MNGYYSIPVTEIDVPFYEIGDAKLFANDGLVVLGNTAFNRFAKIVDHRFAGCVANRGDDGVLVITTPVETYRFNYKPGMECWYQQVPDRSEEGSAYTWWRESVREYGLILSVASLPFRPVFRMLEVYFECMKIVVVLTCGGIFVAGVTMAVVTHLNGVCSWFLGFGPLDAYLPE